MSVLHVYMLRVAFLHAACLDDACYVMHAACLHAVCTLHVAKCARFVLNVWMLHVACLHASCCMLHACCMFGRWLFYVALHLAAERLDCSGLEDGLASIPRNPPPRALGVFIRRSAPPHSSV